MTSHTRLDRLIGYFAPALAARRAVARLALENVRAYDAAQQDRGLGARRLSAASANVEAIEAAANIRFRARDLERNHRLVQSAITRFAAKVVGTGITPRAVHENVALRQLAQDEWNRFCDTCDPEGQHDYYGLQSLAARSMFRDGEVLRLWLGTPRDPDSKIKLLEPDYLDESSGGTLQAASARLGIEFDNWGGRKGYWLFPYHPGETAMPFNRETRARLVPADRVDHFFQAQRPGQARGVSWLASTIVTLAGIDDMTKATIWRKRMEACVGLIFSSPETQGNVPMVGDQKKNTQTGLVEEIFRPGMTLRTGPGESVTTLAPAPSTDSVEFTRMLMYGVCAATGLAYHEVTGDVSQANYSSLRAATLAGNAIIDMAQWLIMAPREKRAWTRVMNAAALRTGKSELRNVRAEWAMPARQWVDPMKEVMAKIAEIRAGLQTMPDALAERGLDWQAQLAELQAWFAALDSAGVILDSDPRRVTGSGALQSAALAAANANP